MDKAVRFCIIIHANRASLLTKIMVNRMGARQTCHPNFHKKIPYFEHCQDQQVFAQSAKVLSALRKKHKHAETPRKTPPTWTNFHFFIASNAPSVCEFLLAIGNYLHRHKFAFILCIQWVERIIPFDHLYQQRHNVVQYCEPRQFGAYLIKG
ncbi:hypothetical protein [Pacificibacter marinus]|uniref:hypothetical protein n=1 Tax=Pacificibacter marinus TaxID=658057 RepID=UPI001C07C8CE|nr:hypothetical protein [Pacificibacter marinus]MBU2866093.1 hypothetical protein [Pacificibacter marinus]